MEKRTKLIVLLCTVLAVSTLLCSCGASNINSYFNLFDKDMPYESSVTYDSQYIALTELDGYVIDSYTDDDGYNVELVSEDFVVFVKMLDSGILSHKVLSMRTGNVIATFAAKNTTHAIRLADDAPAFRVTKTVIDPDIDIWLGLDNVISVDYSLYDAAGNCVVTTDNEEMPYALADMLIYDYAAYTYDAAGIITKKMDVPEYLLLEDCFDWNDKYIYVADANDGFTVYDRDLNSVSYWSAPAYTMDGCDMYVMNGLDVLVQYKVILDNDAEEFDYVINDDDYKNLKIDLETFIIDAKTGKATELKNFPYVIGGLVTKESMIRESDDPDAEDYFKFENLVILLPIEQTRLNDSERAIDMRKMSDNGKLLQSVKFVDFQKADIPSRISEKLFTVGLLSGQTAIIEANGSVKHKLDKSYRIVDQYIVGTQAIYDFDMETVYDLHANKATVMGIIDSAIYINVETSVGYDIISLRGGKATTLYSFNAEAPSGNIFDLNEYARYYMIFDAASGKYSYYNFEDEYITNSDELLTLRHASDMNMAYLVWNASAWDLSYSLFVSNAS